MISFQYVPQIFLLILGQINAAPIINVVGTAGNQLEAAPGLVRLETNIVAESYAWFVFDPPNVDYLTTNNDRTLVFAACNVGKTYSVGLITVDFTNKNIRQYRYFVKITGDAPVPIPPEPSPEPNPPTPNPEPIIPDSQWGLVKYAYQTAKPINDAQKAQLLANNFNSIAAAIAAGTMPSMTDANNALKGLNQTTLPTTEDKTRWTPFFSSFATKMKELGVNNLTDLRACFLEIEKGLRYVK